MKHFMLFVVGFLSLQSIAHATSKSAGAICDLNVTDYSLPIGQNRLSEDRISFDFVAAFETKTVKAKYKSQEILFVVSASPRRDEDSSLLLQIFDSHAVDLNNSNEILSHTLGATLATLPQDDSGIFANLDIKVPGAKSIVASILCSENRN